jgi:transposase
MNKDELQKLIDLNMSSYDIAKYLNKSQGSIQYWIKKFKIKTNYKSIKFGGNPKQKNSTKYMEYKWDEIQEYYKSHSWSDTSKKFNVSYGMRNLATIHNLFIPRTNIENENFLKSIPRSHNNETKKLLSIKRKEYLKNNPDKRWQTKESHKSIPCEKVKDLLKSNNIDFIPEFQPLLHKNRYFSVDIAFPNKKIGVEINGRQHYDSNGNLLPYYQSRHDLIENDGWKLYEIPYNTAFNNEYMLSIVNKILECENKITFDYKLYQPKQKIKKQSNFIKTKYVYPNETDLKTLASNMRLIELSKYLNIPMKTLWAYLKDRNIICKKMASEIKTKNENWRDELSIKNRKVTRPSIDELRILINEYPMTEIGKKYGVSDNAIRKWLKRYGIKLENRRGYWQKKKSGPTNWI